MADAATIRSNAGTEHLLLGFSDLRTVRTRRPLVLAGGDGVRVIDENGKSYIEACASFYCAALGYSEPELIEAARRQMEKLPFYVSAQHRTVEPVLELTDKLVARVPIANAHVTYAATGSEANDYLVKFMRYRNYFAGMPERRKIISRTGSYHGSTIASASLGGAKSLHDAFALDMEDFLLVDQPDYFNGARPGESEAEFIARLLGDLERTILEAGPETVGGFIAEPVSFSAGLIPPPDGYFTGVKEILDRYGILYFDDQVITAFGRMGAMFADDLLGFEADTMVLSKSLSGAYFPIAALVMSQDFYDGLEAGSDAEGGFHHAGTYHGHPVGAAIAARMIDLIEERDLIARVNRLMPVLHRYIDAYADHELVVNTRKIGFAGAIQFGGGVLAERRGKLGAEIQAAALDHGIIVRPVGDSVIVAPPLIVTEAEIAEIFDGLDKAIEDVRRAARP